MFPRDSSVIYIFEQNIGATEKKYGQYTFFDSSL